MQARCLEIHARPWNCSADKKRILHANSPLYARFSPGQAPPGAGKEQLVKTTSITWYISSA